MISHRISEPSRGSFEQDTLLARREYYSVSALILALDQPGEDGRGSGYPFGGQRVTEIGEAVGVTRMASALPQGALVGGGPRVGKLVDQVGEVSPGQPGEDPMGEGRTGPCWREHPRMMPVGPRSCPHAACAISNGARPPGR
jgi:hypothetical protein